MNGPAFYHLSLPQKLTMTFDFTLFFHPDLPSLQFLACKYFPNMPISLHLYCYHTVLPASCLTEIMECFLVYDPERAILVPGLAPFITYSGFKNTNLVWALGNLDVSVGLVSKFPTEPSQPACSTSVYSSISSLRTCLLDTTVRNNVCFLTSK